MKYNTKDLEAKMKKTIESLNETLASIRASQANPSVLNRVTFEYYGSPTEITAMAGVSVADAKTLVINPYDKTTIKAIEKAILASNIGITPSNDGSVIRLIFPQLTEERRRELAKQVQKYGEDAKVAIRNQRRTANDEIKKQKKDSTMTEDEQKDSEKSVQDLTDKFIKDIEKIIDTKSKEIMTV